ncbi:unnamed protein product, partial [Ostreobium quekettii]
MVQYPENRPEGKTPYYVAHWCHPIEVELVAKSSPDSSKWPAMIFQVCSYDRWERYTSEGYGWMSLSGKCPGSSSHVVRTWKPTCSSRDKAQKFFIGGSPELEDMSYAAAPRHFSSGKLPNKYGFQADTSGILKIRFNSIIQQREEVKRQLQRRALPRPGHPPSPRPTSLAAVVARAKSRLREAKGGDVEVPRAVVAALTSRPSVTRQPSDVTAREGTVARFSVSSQ